MSALFVKCDCDKDEPTPITQSVIEKISREWELTAATKNGADAGFDKATFFLTLNEVAGAADSFSITVGASPVSPSPGGSSGDWAMNASNTEITFLPGTANENTVSLVGTPTETSLKIKWVDSADKTDPEYIFTFTAK
jgi:hypothetical protein